MEDAEELARGEAKRLAQQERHVRREQELRDMGELPPLTAEEQERVARGGKSMREVLWIWRGAGTTGADADLEEGKFGCFAGGDFLSNKPSALCIEWCKAYACTRRWEEEVRLVAEEVRRIRVALEYRACEWESRMRGVPIGATE
jgi:hypothetical protein